MRSLSDFSWGLWLPVQAAILVVRTPKLWPWVLLPLIVTVGTYYYLWADVFLPWQTSITAGATHALAGLFGVEQIESIKSGLSTLISILLAAFFWIIAILVFSSVSNLATLPFNDFLAEAVEPLCIPALTRSYPEGIVAFLQALWVDLRKSIFSMLIILVTFMFSWIPIMNIVALLLVALALTLQYSGYASTRRGLGVRASVALCFKTLPMSLGLGLACMVLLSIPFIKLFVPPIAVVAGTLLFAKSYSSQN